MKIQNTENSEKESSETKKEIKTKREANKHKTYLSHDRLQDEPSKGVLRKWCPKNMQQIDRKTPMWKFNFNKVAVLLNSHFSMCVLL